jgi:drug/metabolite transporter (DMT)-like permease
MDSSSERRKALLFLVFAAILWSTSGVLIKTMDWQPIAILSARSLFASLVFLVYLRRLPTRFNRWQLLAAGASTLTQFLFITSLQLTTAANAIFLQYTAPIYVVLLGFWFLREKPSRTDYISMAVIFLGLLFFFGDQLSMDGLYGNLLAIISGVTSAVMMVSFRAQKDGAPEESFLLGSLVTVIIGLPFILQESGTASNWLVIAFLGIFQIGLAFIFFTQAIKHIPALEANLVGTLEVILNPVWVFLFLGEGMGTFALIGGLIVLGGVILSAVGSATAAKEAS